MEKELQCEIDSYKRYCDELLVINKNQNEEINRLNIELARANILNEKSDELINILKDIIEIYRKRLGE